VLLAPFRRTFLSQRRPAPSRSGTRKRPPPRKPMTEQFGSSRMIQVAIISFAALIICSLIGGALVTLPFGGLFDDDDPGDAENLNNPNEELIAEQMEVVEGNPEDIDAILLLANIMGNSGRLEEAIPYYEQAVDLAPDDSSVRLDFARSLADGDLQQDAELQFQRALELEPDSQEAMYYLAELYFAWSPPRTEEAMSLLEKVIALNPDSFIAEQAQRRLDSISATPISGETPAIPAGDGTGG